MFRGRYWRVSLLSVTLFVGCAHLGFGTDPHPAVGDDIKTIRGWRVENDHIGEWIPVPAPDRVTVLDFWSSFCDPCIEAMPELEAIWQRMDQAEVQIIGVSIDTDDNLTRKTMAEKFSSQVTFPMIYDGKAGKLQDDLKVAKTVPSTFVLDREGRVRFYFDGSEGDLGRLEKAVLALVEEK